MNKQQRLVAKQMTDQWIDTVLRGAYVSEEERLRRYIAEHEALLPKIKAPNVRQMIFESIDRARRAQCGETVEPRYEFSHPQMCPVVKR